MLLKEFDESAIKHAANIKFPNQYVDIMKSDIYVKDVKAGRYQAPWLSQEFYVSTDYVYENRMVNGNITRYKTQMMCILVKRDPYEILYDTKDHYYVVCEEENEIQFLRYVDVIAQLPKQVVLLEELRPV